MESFSRNVQQLARQYVDGNRFVTSDEVLVFAMQLFDQFEKQYHDELGKSLKVAFENMDAGETITFNSENEINSFFDDLQQTKKSNSRNTTSTE